MIFFRRARKIHDLEQKLKYMEKAYENIRNEIWATKHDLRILCDYLDLIYEDKPSDRIIKKREPVKDLGGRVL